MLDPLAWSIQFPTLAVCAGAHALSACGRTDLQAPKSFRLDAGQANPAQAVEASDGAFSVSGEVQGRDFAVPGPEVGDARAMDIAGEAPGAKLCGNGIMDPGEECEFGSPGAGEACLPTCRCGPFPSCVGVPTCGNGRLDSNEECDDGNTNSDDGCTACCQRLSPMLVYALDQCGHNILVSARPWLVAPIDCGNGIVDTFYQHEECDDGNTFDGDGCSASCRLEPLVTPASCGNGVLDPGEECDDGINNGGYGECAVGCRLGARCGDAIVQTEAGEQCDRGGQNNTGGYYGCASNCRLPPHCGDGIVQIELGEQCDNGNDLNGDGCLSDCHLGR